VSATTGIVAMQASGPTSNDTGWTVTAVRVTGSGSMSLSVDALCSS
jgi:hypothetical protein